MIGSVSLIQLSISVALGGAPLALGALGALAAGRGILSGTAARRQKIQDQIAAREAEKKRIQAEADPGGLATATVSFDFMVGVMIFLAHCIGWTDCRSTNISFSTTGSFGRSRCFPRCDSFGCYHSR